MSIYGPYVFTYLYNYEPELEPGLPDPVIPDRLLRPRPFIRAYSKQWIVKFENSTWYRA